MVTCQRHLVGEGEKVVGDHRAISELQPRSRVAKEREHGNEVGGFPLRQLKQEISRLLWFSGTTFGDWLENTAPQSTPTRKDKQLRFARICFAFGLFERLRLCFLVKETSWVSWELRAIN